MKTLLKGGTVISGGGRKRQDVLFEEDRIIEVARDICCDNASVTDVSGKLLFPGFIDAHTHFDLEVSGTVTADDFYSGTRSAVAGGVTAIVDFATQNRGETLALALANWHKKADGNCSCDYGFHMAISDWNPEVMGEVADMTAQGVTSFKVYMTYDAMFLSDKKIYQVLKCMKKQGGLLGVHCENKELIEALSEELREAGKLSVQFHPLSRPAETEAEAVGRLLKIASIVDVPVMIVHLSTGEGYREALYARGRGQRLYLETCPQYLLLDDKRYSLPGFEGAKYVIAPPLRKRADQNILWEALGEDEIQTVSTDHCSFTMAQKELGKDDFTKIPCGMPGVETRPVLMYTYGVLEKRITLEQMCRLLSENPSKLYGMYPKKGKIAPGSDADIVVWDPQPQWTLSESCHLSRADYQPFEGFPVRGKAEKVYLRGLLAAENGRVLEERRGRYIKRGRPVDVL